MRYLYNFTQHGCFLGIPNHGVKGSLPPPEASVNHEDDDRHDLETTPHRFFPDLELIHEDVSDGHQWNTLLIGHEERQTRSTDLTHQMIRVGGVINESLR